MRKVKADQRALDRQYISEYRHRHLFGKLVTVTYRWHGKVHNETAFFEGLQPFFHDVIPVFRQINRKGKPSKAVLGSLYSLNQIVEIKEIKR